MRTAGDGPNNNFQIWQYDQIKRKRKKMKVEFGGGGTVKSAGTVKIKKTSTVRFLEVGDFVRIVRSGGIYDRYEIFANKHHLINWKCDREAPDIIYKIILIEPHLNDAREQIAVLEHPLSGHQFLLNTDAISLVRQSEEPEPESLLPDELFKIDI